MKSHLGHPTDNTIESHFHTLSPIPIQSLVSNNRRYDRVIGHGIEVLALKRLEESRHQQYWKMNNLPTCHAHAQKKYSKYYS